MATTLHPTSLAAPPISIPMPMPVDTLLAMHQRHASSESAKILAGVADSESGLRKIECVIDPLPDTLEAIRATPLDRTHIDRLHSLAEELRTLAVKLKEAAKFMATHCTPALRHVALAEARAGQLRVLGEEHPPLGDESTCCTGEDA